MAAAMQALLPVAVRMDDFGYAQVATRELPLCWISAGECTAGHGHQGWRITRCTKTVHTQGVLSPVLPCCFSSAGARPASPPGAWPSHRQAMDCFRLSLSCRSILARCRSVPAANIPAGSCCVDASWDASGRPIITDRFVVWFFVGWPLQFLTVAYPSHFPALLPSF